MGCDQLSCFSWCNCFNICSGGSDYIVNLWRIASISSAPFDTASLTTGDMNTSVIEDDIEVASNMSEDAASDSVDARVRLSIACHNFRMLLNDFYHDNCGLMACIYGTCCSIVAYLFF